MNSFWKIRKIRDLNILFIMPLMFISGILILVLYLDMVKIQDKSLLLVDQAIPHVEKMQKSSVSLQQLKLNIDIMTSSVDDAHSTKAYLDSIKILDEAAVFNRDDFARLSHDLRLEVNRLWKLRNQLDEVRIAVHNSLHFMDMIMFLIVSDQPQLFPDYVIPGANYLDLYQTTEYTRKLDDTHLANLLLLKQRLASDFDVEQFLQENPSAPKKLKDKTERINRLLNQALIQLNEHKEHFDTHSQLELYNFVNEYKGSLPEGFEKRLDEHNKNLMQAQIDAFIETKNSAHIEHLNRPAAHGVYNTEYDDEGDGLNKDSQVNQAQGSNEPSQDNSLQELSDMLKAPVDHRMEQSDKLQAHTDLQPFGSLSAADEKTNVNAQGIAPQAEIGKNAHSTDSQNTTETLVQEGRINATEGTALATDANDHNKISTTVRAQGAPSNETIAAENGPMASATSGNHAIDTENGPMARATSGNHAIDAENGLMPSATSGSHAMPSTTSSSEAMEASDNHGIAVDGVSRGENFSGNAKENAKSASSSFIEEITTGLDGVGLTEKEAEVVTQDREYDNGHISIAQEAKRIKALGNHNQKMLAYFEREYDRFIPLWDIYVRLQASFVQDINSANLKVDALSEAYTVTGFKELHQELTDITSLASETKPMMISTLGFSVLGFWIVMLLIKKRIIEPLQTIAHLLIRFRYTKKIKISTYSEFFKKDHLLEIREVIDVLPLIFDEYSAIKQNENHLKQRYEELVVHSKYDALTKVFNRGSLNALVKEIDDATPADFAIIMVDIDHFKKLNDSMGHQCGDEVLFAVAQTLHSNLAKKDLVFRYGGEEFCVILSDVNSPNAFKIADRLCKRIEGLKLINKGIESGFVTVSVGLSTVTTADNQFRINDLISQADQALYNAKNSGRNRVCAYDNVTEEDVNAYFENLANEQAEDPFACAVNASDEEIDNTSLNANDDNSYEANTSTLTQANHLDNELIVDPSISSSTQEKSEIDPKSITGSINDDQGLITSPKPDLTLDDSKEQKSISENEELDVLTSIIVDDKDGSIEDAQKVATFGENTLTDEEAAAYLAETSSFIFDDMHIADSSNMHAVPYSEGLEYLEAERQKKKAEKDRLSSDAGLFDLNFIPDGKPMSQDDQGSNDQAKDQEAESSQSQNTNSEHDKAGAESFAVNDETIVNAVLSIATGRSAKDISKTRAELSSNTDSDIASDIESKDKDSVNDYYQAFELDTNNQQSSHNSKTCSSGTVNAYEDEFDCDLCASSGSGASKDKICSCKSKDGCPLKQISQMSEERIKALALHVMYEDEMLSENTMSSQNGLIDKVFRTRADSLVDQISGANSQVQPLSLLSTVDKSYKYDSAIEYLVSRAQDEKMSVYRTDLIANGIDKAVTDVPQERSNQMKALLEEVSKIKGGVPENFRHMPQNSEDSNNNDSDSGSVVSANATANEDATTSSGDIALAASKSSEPTLNELDATAEQTTLDDRQSMLSQDSHDDQYANVIVSPVVEKDGFAEMSIRSTKTDYAAVIVPTQADEDITDKTNNTKDNDKNKA